MRKLRRIHITAVLMPLAVCLVVHLPVQQSFAQSQMNVWRSSGPNASITTVIVDPFNPNIIYAGGNGVFKSFNNGVSWLRLGLDGASDFSVDHVNPNTIYAAYGGVYKSTDGGLNWINLNAPSASKVQVSPSDPNFIVAAAFSNGNIHVTNNGGVSWETRQLNPVADYLDSLEIDPQDPNYIYASFVWGGDNFLGLTRSNNAGATWTPFNHVGGFIGSTLAFNADSSDPKIVYSSACSGGSFCSAGFVLYKSIDGGSTWTPRGTMSTYRLAISPQSPGTIYAARYPSGGVYRSLDDGLTWSAFNDGLTSQIIMNYGIRDLAFDRSGRFLHAATETGVYNVPFQAGVAISGRVISASGQGIRSATVVLTDEQGSVWTAATSSFGLYSFGDIPAGGTYTISVASRRYRFTPRTLAINDNLTDINFIGLE